MPTSCPCLRLDADTLLVTPNLGNEILLFAEDPQAVAARLELWARDFGISVDLDRPITSYSGGEQVLLAVGLWAILLARHPGFVLDLRQAAPVLSSKNRTRLLQSLASILPQASVLTEEKP